jgi:hypothetical protein
LERRGRSTAFAEPIRKRFTRTISDTVAGSEHTDTYADGNANTNAEPGRHGDPDPDPGCDTNTNHTFVSDHGSVGTTAGMHMRVSADDAK